MQWQWPTERTTDALVPVARRGSPRFTSGLARRGTGLSHRLAGAPGAMSDKLGAVADERGEVLVGREREALAWLHDYWKDQ